jgi:hypothetical protein
MVAVCQLNIYINLGRGQPVVFKVPHSNEIKQVLHLTQLSVYIILLFQINYITCNILLWSAHVHSATICTFDLYSLLSFIDAVYKKTITCKPVPSQSSSFARFGPLRSLMLQNTIPPLFERIFQSYFSSQHIF